MSSLLNNVMISKCNICHEYKNTCQKIEYCEDCKVYICKQCIKTWCQENSLCPICRTKETLCNYEEEDIENISTNRSINCHKIKVFPEDHDDIQEQEKSPSRLYKVVINISWCWLYFIVLFLIGGLFDIILYGIFFISDEEDVRQFEYVHTQPGYYLIFPLYGIILISVVFLCYVYLETPCFHCKKSLS